jgi:hypothetical protein
LFPYRLGHRPVVVKQEIIATPPTL